MANAAMNHERVKKLVLMAMFTAIVVVLQVVAAQIKIGMFSITLTLAPIIVGAALCGPLAGAWLGAVFGVVVLLSGDAAPFMAIDVPGTVITVMVKGIAAGLVSGLVYKAVEGKNPVAATLTAAVVSPVMNTGIFVLGCFIWFFPVLQSGAASYSGSVVKYILFGVAGGNFLVELVINLLLSSPVTYIIKQGKKA